MRNNGKESLKEQLLPQNPQAVRRECTEKQVGGAVSVQLDAQG